jgi:C1A family cysteine protease
MKVFRCIVLAITAITVLSSTAGNVHAQRLKKAPKPDYVSPAENFGYLPPPVDVKGLRPSPLLLGRMAPPPSWDWRALGGVTSVKNQNPYGTCWAFAGIGDIESKVLIQESATNDYSEVNIVACNPTGTTCNSGGNAWMVTNYLSLLGTVTESCNTYPDGCPSPSCINPACPYLKMVTEWRLIPDDVTAIKNAIMTYGPVYSGMYASFPGFSTYNGSTCLQYSGTQDQNHAVLIVGWDDSMCSGAGAWIVKNSWGTSWGDAGYFYIKYGSARIGENACVITGYKEYDPEEAIYHYDEWGWWGSVGYGDDDDWALVAFTPADVPPEGNLLKAVDIWATWGPTDYSIEIYDDFNGTAPSNRLAGPLTGSFSEAGYYSVALPSPLTIYSGNSIYIVVRFTTPGNIFTIPMDDSGPKETNKSYLSDTGLPGTWEALDNGGYGYGDVGIRARVAPRPATTSCSREGDPAIYLGWGELDGLPYNQPGIDFADAYPGQSLSYQLAPCNVPPTWTPPGCKDTDTLCCHVADSKGWTITADPPLGMPTIIAPGECWIQDVYIEIPCSASVCAYDTVIVRVAYVDVNGVCAPECADCNDPNVDPGTSVKYYDADTLIIHIVEAPPSFVILQDTMTLVDRGQAQAYVPFMVCNQDPCAPPFDFNYTITSEGHVGSPLNVNGTVSVPGGECRSVYGIVDASAAFECDHDTLRIIAWVSGPPAVYDTCVQVIHVVEPQPVPLFTKPVVTILVLALVIVAAIFMRRRVKSSK